MSLHSGERQVAPSIDGIRRDHVARYEFVAKQLRGRTTRILDFGCGIGYGTSILARDGHYMLAIDRDSESIAYAHDHYNNDTHIAYRCAKLEDFEFEENERPVSVAFEIIEHLIDPLSELVRLRHVSTRLFLSVPNETMFPWRGYKFHHRHYTRAELEYLLARAGWGVDHWYGQQGVTSEVEPFIEGRTIVVDCTHREPVVTEEKKEGSAPEHVVILGLGPSLGTYLEIVKRLGSRQRFADEVWGINCLGDVFQCDRVFHMDDVRIQEIRAEADPSSHIAAMLPWLKGHPGPIYTSIVNDDYPGLVAFPLQEVINHFHYSYFNSTAAYAVAYALYVGAKKISLFGIDFTYANVHTAEKGRGCVEFWLGMASAMGVHIAIPTSSSLMDANTPLSDRLYGYDMMDLSITPEGQVSMTPREVVPTAEEMEARYDHNLHPAGDLADV